MATECSNPIGGFTPASEIVVEQFEFFTDLVNEYLNAANNFSQILENYSIEPIEIQSITWDVNTGFTPFEAPVEPDDFVPPPPQFTGSEPVAPNAGDIDTSGLDALQPPNASLPLAPPIHIPPPPIVTLPTIPEGPPILEDVPIPEYEGQPLPEVPTLIELNLPEVPDINIDDLIIERPVFIPPDALQDTYRYDFQDYQNIIWTGVDAQVGATGVYDMHARLQAMLAGGTGLPANIEQALFDRAIGREEVSSIQAVAQAEGEWAARGFDLPGSTLLARTQEIRQANRIERGRVNRELSIQFHTQEIENLRFSVEQAIGLEGTLLDAHTKIHDIARQLADGHWLVAKGIYDSAIDIFKLYLEIYKTDVEVYKVQLEAELVKLDIYKAELEGQKLIGDINQQYVDIYVAELQGVLAGVEVFKAQVDGANAQIRAQLSKIEAYKAEIDAYTATLQGEKLKVDVYDAQLGGEETKAKIYGEQVDAYSARISAYKTEVDAESAKVDASISVVESETRIYAEQVGAWRAGIQADTANLEAFVEVYRAELGKYTALLSAEQYRVTGEARNFEMEVENQKAQVSTALKQADQAIEQLKHITALGLSATETAAKVNAQLAASAMSAVNVSAGMNTSNSLTGSDSRSCTTTYSGVVL
jgi:hypothetical protein